MPSNAIKHRLVWTLVLGMIGIQDAKAVCFKDGVSVDPSKSGPTVSWQVEFRQSTAVVIGMVISAENVPDPKEAGFWSGTFYKVKVDSLLKGTVGDSVDVFSPNDSGRLPLAVGARYLLFLNKEGERLTVDACGNSAKLTSPFR